MTTDPTARELLEAAFRETGEVSDDYAIRDADELERTPSGAELIRRADEPRVAEVLTVEALARALSLDAGNEQTPEEWDMREEWWARPSELAARIMRHLPAPRPPEPPDLRVTKGPGTFGPDATWTIRTEPARTAARHEGRCDRCGGVNVVWWADHDLWNATVRTDGVDEWPFLCPSCFATVVEERGVAPATTVWKMVPSNIEAPAGPLGSPYPGRKPAGAAHAVTPEPAPVADGTVCKCGCSVCPCSNPSEKDWRWCIDCESGNHVAGYRTTPTPPTPEATDAAE